MSTSTFHKGDVPEATLRAARALLERSPADQISVRELARLAGVSHAAPYRHFGDRDGFITALTATCFAEFLRSQESAVEKAADGDRLLALGEAYVRFAVEHPYVFQLVYATRTGDDPTLGELAARHEGLLGSCVLAAVEAGRLPANREPADLGQALWSQAHGLANLVSAGFLDADRIRPVLSALLL